MFCSRYTDVNAWKRDYFSSSLKGKPAHPPTALKVHPRARKDPRLERRSIATDFISSVGHFFGTFFKSGASGRVQQLAGIRDGFVPADRQLAPRPPSASEGSLTAAARRAALRDLAEGTASDGGPYYPAFGLPAAEQRRSALPSHAAAAGQHWGASPAALADGPDEAAAAVVDSLFGAGRLAGQPAGGSEAARSPDWRAEGGERRRVSQPAASLWGGGVEGQGGQMERRVGWGGSQPQPAREIVADEPGQVPLGPLLFMPAGASGGGGGWENSPGDEI